MSPGPDIRDLEGQLHDLCHMASIAVEALEETIIPDRGSADQTRFAVRQTLVMARGVREFFLAAAYPKG